VLSLLLFIIARDALSGSFKQGLPLEALHADDLVQVAESDEKL